MHQTLYRKYRPSTFDEVCGQDHITSVLRYEVENERTSHAYLFCGSRGTGKTSCAKILAKAVNCEHPVGGNPCGKCPSCLSIDNGSTTDVLEMDAASNTGVDYIRDIRDEVVYTPAMLKKRVYIIDEVHMLSIGAFNALLKTLEEPPEHVVFILATTEFHKLPATIVSRCQRFDFHRISVSVLADRLEYIAGKESIALTRRAAEMIARQAQGGMRDSISLFELCASGGKVDEERVTAVLGLSSYGRVAETAGMVADGNVNGLFKTVSELVSSSKDLSVFWQELQNFFRDMLIMKNAEDPLSYLDLSHDEFDLLSATAERFSMPRLLEAAAVMESAAETMTVSPQTRRMTAEFALVRLSDPRLSATPDALLARIAALEDQLALLRVHPEKLQETVAAPVEAPKPAPAAKPSMQPVAETADKSSEAKEPSLPTDGAWMPVRDMSEVVERISRVEVTLRDFLLDCRVFVSPAGDAVRMETGNDFAIMMLGAEHGRKLLGEALAVAKITSPNPTIEFVKKEIKKDDAPDFGDFASF